MLLSNHHQVKRINHITDIHNNKKGDDNKPFCPRNKPRVIAVQRTAKVASN